MLPLGDSRVGLEIAVSPVSFVLRGAGVAAHSESNYFVSVEQLFGECLQDGVRGVNNISKFSCLFSMGYALTPLSFTLGDEHFTGPFLLGGGADSSLRN